jgi:orsellinic acid C2-O-methyltransferase
MRNMTDANAPAMGMRAEMIEMIGACWSTQICGTAARLRVPEVLADGPRAAAAVASAIGCPEPPTRRLLRGMCSLGLARQLDADRFALTDKGQLLRPDVPGSLHGLALAWTSRSWDAWTGLEHGIRTGETTVPSGVEGFASMAHNPDAAATLNASQASRSRGVATEAARVFDFSRFADVMDVGGGYGTVLAAVLAAHPHLTGAVVELPYLEADTLAFLAAEGVAERARFIGGSFFDSVPAGADCYILKSILHDWTDEQCAAILRNVAAASKPGGTLLVIEQVLPEIATDDPRDRSAFRTDLNMLLSTGGLERTEKEFRTLFAAAGFTLQRLIPNESEFMLLEAVRDGSS